MRGANPPSSLNLASTKCSLGNNWGGQTLSLETMHPNSINEKDIELFPVIQKQRRNSESVEKLGRAADHEEVPLALRTTFVLPTCFS